MFVGWLVGCSAGCGSLFVRSWVGFVAWFVYLFGSVVYLIVCWFVGSLVNPLVGSLFIFVDWWFCWLVCSLVGSFDVCFFIGCSAVWFVVCSFVG